MLLFWKIRYLDSSDRQFKDRCLWLDTATLDPLTKAAVETTHAIKNSRQEREILRYRDLFQEERPTSDELELTLVRHGSMGTVFIHDYFEDEKGQELTWKRMAVTLSGNSNAVIFPPGATQNDIEFCLAEKPPINLDRITLTQDQLFVVGYFTRDLRELETTAMWKEGPGSLSGPDGSSKWTLKTAASDEEIRSFVTIFRRLYMENEPANFAKAVATFSEILANHPGSKWLHGIAREYDEGLAAEPQLMLPYRSRKLSFTRKRLIDVFLYTRYAHQPSAARIRQYHECLASIGDEVVLTWAFLTEMWQSAIHMLNAGRVIADFYDRYCQCRNLSDGVLASLRDQQPGLGTLETKEAQEARILREKAEELAKALWESAGRPEGGHSAFNKTALEQLKAATGRADTTSPSRLTDAQRQELLRRADDADANPDDGIPWEEVKAKGRAKFRT